jgi:NitT/TauT family transport system substrate-binding protein
MHLLRFAFWGLVSFGIVMQASAAPSSEKIRVQLMDLPQTQFAGYYLAQARNFFENEGLDVELIPGNPSTNPIQALQDKKVDIAVAWLNQAKALNQSGMPVVNVAQIFVRPSLRLICKTDRGIYRETDLKGKVIGVEGVGDELFIRQLLESKKLDPQQTRFVVTEKPFLDAKNSSLDCFTTTSYDNYLRLIQEDSSTANIVEFKPNQDRLPNFEDGLYVLAENLQSPEFQNKLIAFLRALRQGWIEANNSPAFAIETVLQQNPKLSRADQQYMLEQVLQLIDLEPHQFGLLNIKQLNLLPDQEQGIWTHQIWEKLNAHDRSDRLVSNATAYHIKLVTDNHYYKLLLYFGVFTFALSGILEAINRSYDIYGRLFLGLLSGLGGGTIRDLLIQGERFPFSYIKDPTYPLGILLLVVLATIITGFYPQSHKTPWFENTKKYADIIGFAVLATTGAIISINAGLPWFWAPFFAALSCSGGGVIRDVIINQEPSAFKKTIYEEVAVLGALLMVVGLYFCNQFEHSAYPVVICIVSTLILIIAIRLAVYHFNIQYPKFLGGNASN